MAWRLPLRLGGRDRTYDQEHQALLDALAPGWDIGSDTELWAETRVEALAVTIIWMINRRVRNQALPMRMLDALPDWEQACGLRPVPGDTDVDRRRSVAAKLRGLVGNSLTDISDACSKAMGANFDALITVDPDDWVTYWPGINPGPPGYEFASNRATIGIRVNKHGISEGQFRRKRNELVRMLDDLRPSWMTFVVGTGSSFTVNQGVVGQTVI